MKLELNEEKAAKELKQHILTRSAELFSVNSYRAHKFFMRHTPEENKNITLSLMKYPKLVIEYIDFTVKSHMKNVKEESFCLEDDIAEIYAEMLVHENKYKKVYLK